MHLTGSSAYELAQAASRHFLSSLALDRLLEQKQNKIASTIAWGWPGALVRARRLVLRAGSAAPRPAAHLSGARREVSRVEGEAFGAGGEGSGISQKRTSFGHIEVAKKAHGFKRKKAICSADREFEPTRTRAARPIMC